MNKVEKDRAVGSFKIDNSGISLYRQQQLLKNINDSRCPHGAPVGACPACIGGGASGGGGSSGSTRKSPGLMNWNEAYALWRSIQNAKIAGEDYQKAVEIAQNRIAREVFLTLFRGEAVAILSRMAQVTIISAIAGFSRQVTGFVSQAATALLTAMQNSLNSLKIQIQQTVNRAIDITDKLAAIIGEQQKLIQEALSDSLERLKRRLFKLRIIKKVTSVWQTAEENLEEFFTAQLEKIKKRLSGLFAIFKESSSLENGETENNS